MNALKRFALLSVVLGAALAGAAAWPFVASADVGPQVKTAYDVWGKDARVKAATPEDADPGAWILLGSSDSRAGAEQTLATLARHGGFVRLHIKERQVKIGSRLGLLEKPNGSVQKSPQDGMILPQGPIGEIKPMPPAPQPRPRPKGTVAPLLAKPLQK